MKTLKKRHFVFLKRHKGKLEEDRVVNYSRMNHMEMGLAVTEETMRMVVLEWLQTVRAPKGREKEKRCSESIQAFHTKSCRTASCDCLPHGAQAHLFTGKLSWSLYTVILSFCLQIHIQANTQAWNLIGQELVSWPWSLQFIFEHVDLALHSLKKEQGIQLEPDKDIKRAFTGKADNLSEDKGSIINNAHTRRLSSVRPLLSPFQLSEREKRGEISG